MDNSNSTSKSKANIGCSPSRGSDSDPTRRVDRRRRAFTLGLPAAAIASFWLPGAASAATRQDFYAFGTWAAAPVSAAPADANRVANQTIRQVVHTTLGGDALRLKLSNRYGSSTLVVQAASVGLSTGTDQIVAGSSRPLSFDGRPSFVIPAYGEVYTDWLSYVVPNLGDLAVDIYIGADTSAGTSPLTLHNARPATQVLSYLAAGNVAGAGAFTTQATRTAWYFLTGVDVSNPRYPGSVVCFGDSITDGTASTPYANARYPDYLARRLIAGGLVPPLSVVNLGIGGNRVLMGGTGDNALARFDRDVLTQSSAQNIIVLLGINDFSGGNVAARVIEGHRQLIRRAHTRGLKIFGATLTPYAAAPDAREAERQALNTWIRTSGEYDGVVEFDVAVRDPANPRAIRAAFDSGDTLHPNSAGYSAMADIVDLSLLAGPKVRR